MKLNFNNIGINNNNDVNKIIMTKIILIMIIIK